MARSIPGQQSNRLPALLAVAACLGLAILNWRVLDTEIDISPVPPGDPANTAALAPVEGLPAVSAVTTKAAFPETLARPLFRASRRPPDPAKPDAARTAKAQKPVAALPAELKLVGIVREKGQAERALVRLGEASEGRWLAVGQVVEGWRLARIDDGSIVFEANGEERMLSLFPKNTE